LIVYTILFRPFQKWGLICIAIIEKVGNNYSKNNEINEIKEEGPSLYHSKYPKIYKIRMKEKN